LLLTSFILVCAFSISSAQNTVTVQDISVPRCVTDTLDIDLNCASSISAFEIILEINAPGDCFLTNLNVLWYPGLTELNYRIVDLSMVDYVNPDTIRIAGMMIDSGDVCLSAGAHTVAHLEFTTNACCDGVIDIDAATFTCPSTPVTAQTQFVDCATTTCVPVQVVPGTITIQNAPPTVVCPPDDSIHVGTTYMGTVTGDDPDLVNGCEKLTYTKLSGPSALLVTTIDDYSASITWSTVCADIGTHTVVVQVEDSCGAIDTCSFEICVYNIPPEFTSCPTETYHILWGHTVADQVIASDTDGCTSALEYEVLSFKKDGTTPVSPANYPTVNQTTGEWSWDTEEENEYLGLFELCIKVNDGSPLVPGCTPENADTCCIWIQVYPTIRVYIEKEEGPEGKGAYQGQYTEVSIFLDNTINPHRDMGGYNFLVIYDRSAMNFQTAERGALIDTAACGWEYFTYRWGFCWSPYWHFFWGGTIRIVAMAETNNGAAHPDCFRPNDEAPYESYDLGELAKLTFLVTDNRQFECQFAPIRFYWTDCGDNTISDKSGDSLYISRYVYEWHFDDPGYFERIDNLPELEPDLYSGDFPTYFGANETCDTIGGEDKPYTIRIIDYYNGGVDIICSDSIDARGDLNLNGIPNEIADAVVFTNYFIYGFSAFHVNVDGQTAASDVNADGLTLTVGDLVYLVRIIVGDAMAYPKVTTPVDASYVHGHDGVLRIADDVSIGAALLVMEGDVTPQLLAPDMEMKYNFDGENTRILVYSLAGNSFTGEFLNVSGEIVSIEMATREGNPVNAELIPADFALNQNYPNPFNPATTISFSLPTACHYTLTIYNVNGQEVKSFVGDHEAGFVELTWDAANHASGVYFYKLSAGDFSATKKMVLLK